MGKRSNKKRPCQFFRNAMATQPCVANDCAVTRRKADPIWLCRTAFALLLKVTSLCVWVSRTVLPRCRACPATRPSVAVATEGENMDLFHVRAERYHKTHEPTPCMCCHGTHNACMCRRHDMEFHMRSGGGAWHSTIWPLLKALKASVCFLEQGLSSWMKAYSSCSLHGRQSCPGFVSGSPKAKGIFSVSSVRCVHTQNEGVAQILSKSLQRRQ